MEEQKPLQSSDGGNLENKAVEPLPALDATGIKMSQSAWWDGLRQWMSGKLSKSGTPPFSFDYDGVNSSGFLSTWDFSVNETTLDETRTLQTVTYTEVQTGLEVRCEVTLFADHPAVEWVLKFRNTGECDTPIIANIQALDTVLHDEADNFKLHYTSGPKEGVAAGSADFGPNERELDADSTLKLSSIFVGRKSALLQPRTV